MFCENCGTKNDDSAAFCEKCGSALNSDNNFTVQNTQPTFQSYENPAFINQKKTPMSLKNKIILIVCAVVALILAVLYFVGSNIYDPKKTVENYFELYVTQNYEAMYDCLDIEESDFTNKEMFVKMNKDKKLPKIKVTNYSIQEKLSSEFLQKEYVVSYTVGNEAELKKMNITLSKQNKKAWLVFEQYKVCNVLPVAKQYTVYVPEDTELYVSGIKVSEKYLSENDNEKENTDCYVLENIFSGNHTIEVKSELTQDYSANISISENGQYTVDNLKPSKKSKNEMLETSKEVIEKIYAAAIARDDFSVIEDYFSEDYEEAEDDFYDFCDEVKDIEGYGLKEISFANFRAKNTDVPVRDGNFGIYGQFDYTYTYVYEDYWDEEVVEYTPDGMEDGEFKVEFKYDDGKWLIEQFDINAYLYY